MKNLTILGLSAMILASCGTTQHKQEVNNNINADIQVSKNNNNMDNDYLILLPVAIRLPSTSSVLRRTWSQR